MISKLFNTSITPLKVCPLLRSMFDYVWLNVCTITFFCFELNIFKVILRYLCELLNNIIFNSLVPTSCFSVAPWRCLSMAELGNALHAMLISENVNIHHIVDVQLYQDTSFADSFKNFNLSKERSNHTLPSIWGFSWPIAFLLICSCFNCLSQIKMANRGSKVVVGKQH